MLYFQEKNKGNSEKMNKGNSEKMIEENFPEPKTR